MTHECTLKNMLYNPLDTQYSHMGPTHTHIHTCCRPVCCSRRTMEKNPLLPSKSTKVQLTVQLLGRFPFASPKLNPLSALPADRMLSLLQRVSQSLSSSPTVHSDCLRGAAKQSGLAFSLGGRSWKHSFSRWCDRWNKKSLHPHSVAKLFPG